MSIASYPECPDYCQFLVLSMHPVLTCYVYFIYSRFSKRVCVVM